MINTLDDIIIAFHKNEPAEHWVHFDVAIKEKIYNRFFQILFELYSRDYDYNSQLKQQFYHTLSGKIEAGCVEEYLQHTYKLIHWKYSQEEEKLEMVFTNNVYVGSIHDRF
ncbi:hypothetical protein ACTJJ0_32670 [Chitinophaga sp. 22321]|uniref:Uncharacterized protein n=1 Tax=Chitinophaga hostae TaxID=2831022 RepID=A0ABS5J998_9BACT|nr:hypothetical protein [Chitinophaga hostae]MBS0031792.1 hypothetical protein [Chitinophaga hostae]